MCERERERERGSPTWRVTIVSQCPVLSPPGARDTGDMHQGEPMPKQWKALGLGMGTRKRASEGKLFREKDRRRDREMSALC